MPLVFFDIVGKVSLKIFRSFGRYTVFVVKIFQTLVGTKFKTIQFLQQVEKIGIQSIPIGVLTGVFAGGVLSLQTYSTFRQFGSEKLIGPVVALTMARELGPVLTGLMVAGRCSSGIAAEIGTMRITEQIDALETLGIDNYQYLIVPRVVASTIVLPLLTIFSICFGILGGYVVCVFLFSLNAVDYIDGIKELLKTSDLMSGIFKASIFGFILSSVGALQGFYTWGGAKGVGLATTQSVVVASIAILVSNYFLSTLLF